MAHVFRIGQWVTWSDQVRHESNRHTQELLSHGDGPFEVIDIQPFPPGVTPKDKHPQRVTVLLPEGTTFYLRTFTGARFKPAGRPSP